MPCDKKVRKKGPLDNIGMLSHGVLPSESFFKRTSVFETIERMRKKRPR